MVNLVQRAGQGSTTMTAVMPPSVPWSCPTGHRQHIDEEQARNEATIYCICCNFVGYAREGEVTSDFDEQN
jgi:hypothetical protein